jgi:phi LC3 family holin
MNINWKVRFKNPTFWVGIIVAVFATVFAQLGVSWEQVTSWATLGQILLDAVSNPVVVVAVIGAVYNAIIDPTTAGLSDSKNALTYNTPKKE